MIELRFNYNSLRARKARLTVGISRPWRLLLKVMSVGLPISGVSMILAKQPIGWLLLGLTSLPVMVYQWWRYELYRLEVTHDPKTIDDVLSSSVLGRLPDNPSPFDIASIIGVTSSGAFIGLRFGTGVKFFQEIASKNSADTPQIWRDALQIREQTGSHTLSSGCLALAIVKNFPQYEQILAHIQIDYDDLLQGIRWHDYLHARKDELGKYIKTGGIARDWSFGYIPLLKHFGQNISESLTGRRLMSAKIAAHQQIISHMIEVFGSGGRQNVALVGAYGVGKTNIVQGFAERLLDASADIPSNLRFRQVIMLDSARLVSMAAKNGDLEGLVSRILSEAYEAKNIIVCLDNAELFFQDGTGSVDLSKLLMPILEAGNLRIILTMNEQSFLQIAQKMPGIANALNKIMVAPTDKNDTMLVLQDKVVVLEMRLGVIFMYQALKEAYRLGSCYIQDTAMPGQAIKLLESAASYHEHGLVRFLSVQQALEKTLGIKISVVSQADERQKLLNLENIIHQRMVNQVRAVQVVSDALRRARAGVRNQNRPIGTFLFLGPTGVGKTELAKALSETYFSGEDNLIRLDLNEFVTVDSAARLIQSGAKNPHSLTAQVMQKPFSVILLDEIEKAHSLVLTALLQVLDEGILRDEDNKEVSFRDAIIIATSNAGALEIQDYINRGIKVSEFEQNFINNLIQSNQFRPEFLNRFDEIVIFKPLDKPELLQIVNLILKGLNKNLAQQKIQVVVSDDAKEYLVEKGYDPQLGARPMRRIIQKSVENLVAKSIITGELGAERLIEINLADLQNILESDQA